MCAPAGVADMNSDVGATRGLYHIKTPGPDGHEKLLNSRFAYVSVSGARCEAKIYTNGAQAMGLELSHWN